MPLIKQTANEMEEKEVNPCYKTHFTRNPEIPDTLECPETGLFYSHKR